MIEDQPKKEHWVERTILDSFSKLTHKSDKERVKAGCELLKHLNQHGSDEKGSKERQYALERLIRGLSSSRALARSGFFIALVALLINNDTIKAEDVLEVMQKELHISGSKSEKGDIYMGQILACGALLRSGRGATCTSDVLKQIVEIIISSSKQKSYLMLAGYTFLIGFIKKTTEEIFASTLWPVLKPEVAKSWKDQSIDTIRLLHTVRKKFPEAIKQKFWRKHLEIEDLMCIESMPHIAEMLINTPRLDTLKHPFYEAFCKDLAGTDFVVAFWQEIDKHLSKHNDNREIVATTILTYLVTHTSKLSVIPELFSGNFLQALFHRLKLIQTNHSHELNVRNINLFASLAERLSDENVKSKIKLKVIKSLLLYPGDLSFEKITGTKTIQRITSSLDCEGVKKLTVLYRNIIITNLPKNHPKYPNWTIYERVYAAQLFSKLLNMNCTAEEQSWRVDQIKFLMNLGIFYSNDGETICNKDEEVVVGSAVAQSVKECFYNVLANKQKNLNHLRNILSTLVEHSNSIVSSKSYEMSLRTALSGEDLECWHMMSGFIETLNSAEAKETNVKVKKIISVFQILSIHMGFQLFKDSEMARSSIKELKTCFERFRVLGSQKQKKQRKLKEGEEDTEEPEWMEVVVDLILNILSHDSYLLRSVITCVFPHLCPYLNSTVIHQILTVLDPKSEDNPLSRSTESDSSDTNDENSESEDTGNEENVSEKESSEDSDAESEDDCENDTISDKLRMAVSQALGNASDQESIDLDEIDDEEGKRLDKALGDAFKLIKQSKTSNKSKKQSKTDKSLTNFRTRVLDLLLIYLNNEPSMYICLEIMLPLFQILEFAIQDPHQNPLQAKVQSCMKTLCNVKKFSSTDGVTEELLFDLLKSLLNNDATSTLNIARNKENAECCAFIVRCSIAVTQADNTKPAKKELSPIMELYRDQLIAFFTKRDNHLPITFFSNVLSIIWCGNWALIPVCVEQAFNSEIRIFRRALGLKLLQVFYQNYRTLNTNSKGAAKVLRKIEIDLSTNIAALTTAHEAHKNENFFQQLVILLTLVKKYHKMDKAVIPDAMDWDVVKPIVEDMRKGLKLSQAMKSSFNKYCAMLDINKNELNKKMNGIGKNDESHEIPSKKQKLEQNIQNGDVENNSNDDGVEAKKIKKANKKRQKAKALNNDKLQLKKQTKLLRLQASTEGLETVSFSKCNIDMMENGNQSDASQDSSDDQVAQDSDEEQNIDELESPPQQKKKKRRHSSTER